MTAGYKVSIHVVTLEEAQAVQELALEAFGFPVTLSSAERDTNVRPVSQWRIARVVLEHMAKDPSRTYTNESIAITLEEHGFSAASVGPTPGLFRLPE